MSNQELTPSEREEIMATVEPQLTEASLEVVKKRHLRHDEQGNIIETPREMFLRVAEYMARAELQYDEHVDLYGIVMDFYQMMARMEFLPGSRILYEAGDHHDGALASCFVVPLEDSMESVFQTLQDAALIQKRNGGVGYNFSKIRPKSDVVNGVPHIAAGPVHFLETFSTALSQVMQGSKRPGGNMGVLNVDHPDIEEFISFKSEGSRFANFNVSVGVTDQFMEAVREDHTHDLVNPRTGDVVRTVRARELFDKIVANAWRTGDPGMMFLDRIEESNPTPAIGKMDATNPCGEQPLLPYESCNLGSLLLEAHVTDDGKIDWEKLRGTMRKAVRFMDDMLDVNHFPLEQIEQMVRYGNRKIGIGIAGFAHMLYKLGIPYNSEESIRVAEEIQRVLNEEGHKMSGELAEQRGVFPNWEKSIYASQNKKMRNATVTTIAPTGTLAMVPQTSSGVEPVFSLVTVRKSFYEDTRNQNGGGKTLVYVDKVFEQIAKKEGFWSEELMERVADQGTLEGIEEIPARIRRVLVVSHDIHYEWHVRIQAAFQKHCDNAVSKTINFPNDAEVEDVRRAYIMAYELGCKGITIYRDGSKEFQVLNRKKGKTMEKPVAPSVTENVQTPEAVSAFGVQHHTVEGSGVLTENALTVLGKRALRKDSDGTIIETPEELFRRTAHFIASAEEQYAASPEQVKHWEDKFYAMMSSLEFISGQALRNSGAEGLTLSACLVLPIEDSIESILQALNENVISHKSTIGTGFNLSRIRSSYAKVRTSGEHAAGPVKFLKAINAAQGTILTKGGRKQGAMAILNVDHPDIEEFIQAKDQLGQIDHFNISVGAKDQFMEAVRDDGNWDFVDPSTKEIVKTVRARELFDKIAEHAWKSGDPGMIFVDAMDRDNPTPFLGKLDATNPCGEQPLLPYETCNLGSIVLSRMVRETPEGSFEIDWEKFKDRVISAVRFLDDTIDKNVFPLEKITEMTLANRRIGLGVMGFADMLVKLEIPYDSERAIAVSEEIMEFMQQHAHDASEQIALEKGSFPNFDRSIWAGKRRAMRNSAVTTIAPTGYTSIVANCSSGIEPIFALAFKRTNSMGDHDLFEVASVFEEVAKREGFYSQSLMEKISEHGSCKGLDEVPQKWQEIFVTAHEISPEAHVRVQAAFQKHCDNAVSKTINFSEEATTSEIENVYMLAWELGCKGVTIFRDGSKEEQVMHVGNKERDRQQVEVAQAPSPTSPVAVAGVGITPRPRPESVRGTTYKVKTSYGNLFITINDDDQGQPFEIFAQIGKSGGVFQAKSEAICRLASLALRSGINVQEVIKQLKGIRGPMPSWGKKGMILSIPDAIAQTLEDHLSKDQAQLELNYQGSSARAETAPQAAVAAPIVASSMVDSAIEEPTYETVEETTEAVVEGSSAVDTIDVSKEKDELFTEKVVVESSAASEDSAANAQEKVKQKVPVMSIADLGFAPECPECSNVLEMGEGCMVCRVCGYSKCG